MKKRYIKQKCSQTEVFGLLIIVVLFIAGYFFAVSVMSKPPEEEKIKDQFYAAELSQNFVLAMLKTTVEDCKEKTLEDLLVDCNYNEYKCEAAGFSGKDCIDRRCA